MGDIDQVESSPLITPDNIKLVDAKREKDYVDRYHEHGFLNEIYHKVVDNSAFQLQEGSFGFHLNLFESGGSSHDSGISLRISAGEIRSLLSNYFVRHNDDFYKFFPEYKGMPVDRIPEQPKGIRRWLIGKKQNKQEKEEERSSLDKALSGITKAALYIHPYEGNETLNRLKGITALLEEDQESAKELNNLIKDTTKTIFHEKTHILIHKLREFYGMDAPKNAENVLLELHRDEDINNFLSDLYDKAGDSKDPNLLRNLGDQYLRFRIAKIEDKHPGDSTAKNYAKLLYCIGIEETVIRLVEAQIDGRDPEGTVQYLKDELFESPNYYLKKAGVILPEPESIYTIVREKGVKKAFHEILKKYNDQAFEKYLKENQLSP